VTPLLQREGFDIVSEHLLLTFDFGEGVLLKVGCFRSGNLPRYNFEQHLAQNFAAQTKEETYLEGDIASVQRMGVRLTFPSSPRSQEAYRKVGPK